jgi:uncharacterized protein (TIGR03435 family)
MRHSVRSRRWSAAGQVLTALSVFAVCSAQPAGLASARLDAQGAPATSDRPTFDAVEIRPSTAGPTVPPGIRPQPDGGIEFRAFTLWEFLRLAYGQEIYRTPTQVLDGPSWIHMERFDVHAAGQGDILQSDDRVVTPAAPTGHPRVLLDMVRAMLEDHFDLRVRTDRREQEIFALTQSRSGALGPQMAPRATCRPAGTGAASEMCDLVVRARGVLFGWAVSMDRFAYTLSTLPDVGRVVHNETNLAGRFDLKVTWSSSVSPGIHAEAAPHAESHQSLSTAIEQELGLRLEPRRASVDVLIVERIQLP